MASWSDLPSDLIITISKSITTVSEYLLLRSVCSSWRSALSLPPTHLHLPLQPPWLCFPSSLDQSDSFTFFPRPNSKPCSLSLPLPNPRRRFLGSSHGSLIFRSNHATSIAVFNPLTLSQTNLPPFPSFNSRIRKVVISPPPDSTALALSNQLLLYRPGDASWTPIKGTHRIRFHDAVYFDGHFYAVDGFRRMYAYDADGSLTKGFNRLARWNHGRFYLVECESELLLVCRHFDRVCRDHVMENGFEVFRLEMGKRSDGKFLGMVKMDGLGDRVVFLGLNRGVVLSEDECPGFRKNCVYYLDESNFDNVGVFDMSDGKFEVLPYRFDEEVFSDGQPAVWFTPSLC